MWAIFSLTLCDKKNTLQTIIATVILKRSDRITARNDVASNLNFNSCVNSHDFSKVTYRLSRSWLISGILLTRLTQTRSTAETSNRGPSRNFGVTSMCSLNRAREIAVREAEQAYIKLIQTSFRWESYGTERTRSGSSTLSKLHKTPQIEFLKPPKIVLESKAEDDLCVKKLPNVISRKKTCSFYLYFNFLVVKLE